MLDLPAALRQVLRHVIKNLGAVMRRGPGPTRGFPRGFDRVANVLAVAQPYFADSLATVPSDFHAVAGIRSRLLAPDVKFYGAVNIKGRSRGLRFIVRSFRWGRLRGRQCRPALKPGWFQIFQQAFPAALAAVSALTVTAKAAGGVKQVSAIHPDHAGFELRRNVERNIDALAPHARRQAVHGVVG